MAEIKRQSPLQMAASPLNTELRDNWAVALEYDGEGQGPWITDLAHKTRWDLQDNDLGAQRPCDLDMPAAAGGCTFAKDTLINRMNRTQASIFHVGQRPPAMPDFSGYTDVGESTVFLALFGPKAFLIAQKLCNLDFLDPGKTAPFLYQGPFCHVPCQIVTLEKSADGSGGFLLTCSRGYGDSLLHAISEAGAEFGLKPAGENRFQTWVQGLQK